jgi:hypothetical protein
MSNQRDSFLARDSYARFEPRFNTIDGILFWERDAKNMPAPLFRLILSDIRELITAF